MAKRSLFGLASKIFQHAALLRHDPERFGKNVLQYTNPALYERRLIDVIPTPPMQFRVVSDAGHPRFNLLDTSWTQTGMTGGPNTAINLAARVARAGIPTRLVSTSVRPSINSAWLHNHVSELLGDQAPEIEIASASDQTNPLAVSSGDVFMATHWTTAIQLKAVLSQLNIRTFFFLIQEFEAGFYPWSSNHALALEALGMDYWPVVNERLLADYMFCLPYGRLSDAEVQRRAIVFEPAVDVATFHARRAPVTRSRRLLFYARPTNTRNLFGLGLTALRKATESAEFDGWEFLSIGSQDGVPDLPLGGGRVLRRAPWLGYAGYAELLRSADVLLCPMLSPHTSYPVLEMVACGGISVTNTFLTKTKAALKAISEDIIAVEPTVEQFTAGLCEAASRVMKGTINSGLHGLPQNWSESLDPVALRIAGLCKAFGSAETVS